LVERLGSGSGVFVLVAGAIAGILGVAWDDQALTLTGFIAIASGVPWTVFDAKARRHWPWRRKGG